MNGDTADHLIVYNPQYMYPGQMDLINNPLGEDIQEGQVRFIHYIPRSFLSAT